jgi:hypothetical protein
MRTLSPAVPDPSPSDLAGLLVLIAYLRRLGARTFVAIARAHSYPAAVALLDGSNVEPFLRRFFTDGIPAPWHAGTAVRVTVLGLDPNDQETARELAPMARGRWFWASDRDAGRPFVDATTTPPQRGAARAERRRQERIA